MDGRAAPRASSRQLTVRIHFKYHAVRLRQRNARAQRGHSPTKLLRCHHRHPIVVVSIAAIVIIVAVAIAITTTTTAITTTGEKEREREENISPSSPNFKSSHRRRDL